MSRFRIVTLADDPSLEFGRVPTGFQEYNDHGEVLADLWGRLTRDFPEFQFLLVDGDEPVGRGQTIPFVSDGTVDGLGDGIDHIVHTGCADFDAGRPPTTLSALLGVVAPDRRGQGIAADVIRAMGDIGARHELGDLVAPVRPNLKRAYPVTPIDHYIRWTRDDGLPLDPWLRVHVRLGGEFLAPAPRSLKITGTVAEWESWTGVHMPESGEYLFPDALAPVVIDRERDLGTYYEPNVLDDPPRHRSEAVIPLLDE
jgi:hypothetical protein